jgi:hypothetical protein
MISSCIGESSSPYRERYPFRTRICPIKGYFRYIDSIWKLKSYAEELKKELAAVEEHIKELGS